MIDHDPRQAEDGTAHFTYFIAERELSFTWNGTAEHIDVSVGGYGERVTAHAPCPHPRALRRTWRSALLTFRAACDTWAGTHT